MTSIFVFVLGALSTVVFLTQVAHRLPVLWRLQLARELRRLANKISPDNF